MIKFFRHIRKRLLSENKFRKYLLYAIGEIVLVMIGILLALQVNNWNESWTKEIKISNEEGALHLIDESYLGVGIDFKLAHHKASIFVIPGSVSYVKLIPQVKLS
ncbi:hypothetical protein B0O79_3514 [Flavobacteriaceae bacterium MAR_2009_75]|nr:hypothetical protein B0O79_3514 [Flavobacteriaceae bacterium MAR_2009_75]